MRFVCIKCLEKINTTNTDNFIYKKEKNEYFHLECYYLLEDLKNIRKLQTNNKNLKTLPLVTFSKFNYLYDNLFNKLYII